MLEQTSYKRILDSLITAVVALKDDLTVAHINASAEALLGVSGEQIAGKAIDACFIEVDDLEVSFRDNIIANQNFTKRKARWRLHNGNEITVDYSVSPAQEPQWVTIEIQPLDRLLRISREESFIAARETSRNLARSMAHEIKNPLGGIRGAAQLLEKELSDPNLEEYTRIIIHEADRLRSLVDRMLGPRQPPKLEKVNVHEITEHVASVLKAEIGRAICIKRDYDPSIPELDADKGQMIQALLNIARNAMQALTESETPTPEITLSTRILRRYTINRVFYPLVVRLSVRDNGPGVPKDIAENIFFPMISGRATGTGLGLAIAQHLITQQGGVIECQSEPGSTEFDIYLPLGMTDEQD